MNYLVAVVGPTGIGKSRLALRLAQVFHGEIVSADSRQVYRYTDIGTAKPGPKELSLVPHHLIDIVNPDESFSLAQYQALAYRSIQDIQRRHRLPFLVGGSGLYVWAVLEGWQIPQVPPDPALRRSLEEKAVTYGSAQLYQELVKVDPDAAQKIDPRNVRRVIRALEVHQKASAPSSRDKSVHLCHRAQATQMCTQQSAEGLGIVPQLVWKGLRKSTDFQLQTETSIISPDLRKPLVNGQG